jgi:FkbM family methyltransferase
MRALRDYEIEAVIDVGANEGGFGETLRAIGFEGDIYSFEPVIDAYNKLKSLAANDSHWKVFNLALGSQPGIASINVSKFSQFSSLLNATKYASEKWDNMAVEHKQEVEVKTLDACIAEGLLPGGRRYLLKMDTQGFDLEVFKGAESVRSEMCCMLSEMSLIPIYEGAQHYLDVLRVYEKAGFSVSGFFPITRNKNLTLNEVDCLMVNTRKFPGGASK